MCRSIVSETHIGVSILMATTVEKKSVLRDDYGFVVQSSYVSLYHTYAPIWRQEEVDRAHAWDQWSRSDGKEADSVDQALDVALGGEDETLRELKMLVQLGVPQKYRVLCWKKFLAQQKRDVGEYTLLLSKLEEVEQLENSDLAESLNQIDKDLHRTFPDHQITDDQGKQRLRRILGAYAVRNPIVGYCQGLNFLAATFLLVLGDEEDAFWCFVALVEEILTGYFDPKMIIEQVDFLVFEQLLKQLIPKVSSHLENIGVHVPTAITGWFLVAFVNTLPFETMLRVWDILFFEKSPVVIFRVALALLQIYSEALLECSEAGDAYMMFQGIGPISFDAKALVETSTVSFAHVKDSALSVLRDKYAPGVTRVMEKMYNIESNLPSITIRDGALPKKSLSRSGSIKTASSKDRTAVLSTDIEQRLGILRLREKDSSDDGMIGVSAFVTLRRTQSAAFPRSHELGSAGHHERLQQQLRIDLLSMSTFIPDMKLLRTAFEIAAAPSKYRQQEDEDDVQGNKACFKLGHTMDVSDLRPFSSKQKDELLESAVLRRFTDGGALLASSNRNNSGPVWSNHLCASDLSGILSHSRTVDQTKNLTDFIQKLEDEVHHAIKHLEYVSNSNDELEGTVQGISEQIHKLQEEIEHKTTIYNALFQRCTELQSQTREIELEYRRYMTENSAVAQSWKTMQREIHLNDMKLKMLMDMAGNLQRSGNELQEPGSPTKRLKKSITMLINRKFTK